MKVCGWTGYRTPGTSGCSVRRAADCSTLPGTFIPLIDFEESAGTKKNEDFGIIT